MRSGLKRFIKAILTPRRDRTVQIGDIALTYNPRDGGGNQYENRPSFEERNHLIYDRIQSTLAPEAVIDVGANYGFTGAVFARFFPTADLVLIEPDPKLGDYIRRNMSQNGITRYELIQALCGDVEHPAVPFGIHPYSSQDNRVSGLKGWKTAVVASTTLSQVLHGHTSLRTFIKVDTQGFETQVFKGAESFLSNSQKWFIKSEFAPDWLRSQGNSPEELLLYLIERYRVVEAPARSRFGRINLSRLFSAPLLKNEVVPFVKHVQSLNRDGKGWVDIYVAPQATEWMVSEFPPRSC